MNVNSAKIGRGAVFEHYKYSINLLIRFNSTREIFPSVIRVSSIRQATETTRASVEKPNSKECVALCLATCFRKPKVPRSSTAASYSQR